MKNTYTYSYNGKVLVKNSKRDNYKYAYINKETGYKLQISSTREGATKDLNRFISSNYQLIKNCKNALYCIEKGFSVVRWSVDNGRYSENKPLTFYKKYSWLPEEERALEPKDLFNKWIEDAEAKIKWYSDTYIIVEVERS